MPNIKRDVVFKVFGNRERVQLLCCLSKPQSVTELLEKCVLSQSALSQHLAILKEAKMVVCVREGKKQIYSLANNEILSLAKKILTY